jgi:FMN phosphatase YigB (HAD superfamily)
MHNMPKKMIAFDLVGTLIRNESFRDARSNLVLDFDQDWSEAETKANFSAHFDYKAIFQVLLDKISPTTLYQQFRDYLVSHVTDYLYPETCQVLKTLNDHRIMLGFITDGCSDIEGEMIKRILDHCGMERDKCIIVIGQDVGGCKAEGKPFEALVARAKDMGIDRTEIAFVGDKPSADIAGAHKSDLETILIYRNSRPDITYHKPDREITNLSDLL